MLDFSSIERSVSAGLLLTPDRSKVTPTTLAERALDYREDSLRQCSLAVESLIDPRVMRVIDGAKLTVLDQRSHAIFPQFIA